MRNITPSFKFISSLLMLCLVAALVTSMTTREAITNSEDLLMESNSTHFFMDYDFPDDKSQPTAIACSSYSLYDSINCGCAPSSPGNSSPTYSFHKRKYARTCWIVGHSSLSWSEYSPWVCDRVCL